MNTDTGRIYPPEEYDARRLAAERREQLDDHQGEFEAAHAAGKIVPVSDKVARLMQSAHKADAQRKAKRKAQRDARRKNR